MSSAHGQRRHPFFLGGSSLASPHGGRPRRERARAAFAALPAPERPAAPCTGRGEARFEARDASGDRRWEVCMDGEGKVPSPYREAEDLLRAATQYP